MTNQDRIRILNTYGKMRIITSQGRYFVYFYKQDCGSNNSSKLSFVNSNDILETRAIHMIYNNIREKIRELT